MSCNQSRSSHRNFLWFRLKFSQVPVATLFLNGDSITDGGWWRGFIIFSERAFHCKNDMNTSLDLRCRDTSNARVAIANRVGIKKHPFRIRAIKPMKKTCSQALPRPFRYFLFPLTYQSILHSIHTGMDSKVLCAVHTVWSELKNAASSNTGVPPLSWRVHRLVEPVAIIVSSPH
jgi:hypothetical protein